MSASASDPAAEWGGGKKHEIYMAAFGGHLFYDLFVQGWGGHGPLGTPPGSATEHVDLRFLLIRYICTRVNLDLHRIDLIYE